MVWVAFAACACGDDLGQGAAENTGAHSGTGSAHAGGGGFAAGASGRGGGGGGGAGTGGGVAGTSSGASGSGGSVAGVGGSSSGGGGRSGGSGGTSAGNAGAAGASGTESGGSSGNATNAGRGGDAGGGNGGESAGSGGGAGVGGSGGEAGLAGKGGNAGGAGASGSAGATSAPPLGKKFVGNIDTRGQVRSDFADYWNQFSPENAGKWGSVERNRDEMNWASLDRMYEYAKQHNVLFKQHTLLWGSQQPTWLNGLSQSEQREEVEEWIRLFCERYPDTYIMDVVNEPPPHTTPAYVAALGGSGSSGYDWIAQAFKWAHQYCPNAILLLNDYNNIEYQADNARSIDIANKIKGAGAPIDAIGAQAHDAYRLSTSTVEMYINRISDQTGLPVYITEYDIDIGDDNQQKNVMQSQFTMYWNNNHVAGITIWGYVVGSTWKMNTGLMSSSGTPRPALTWLLDFLDIEP